MTFSGPNFPKNEFCGRNFKNLSLDSRSSPPIYHVCQFSVEMDNSKFFGLNLGKFPYYVEYFGSNNVEGVAKSWGEVKMSWVEVDRAGWRWVHGLVIPFLHIFLMCLLNFNFRSIAIPKIISSSLFFKLHLFKLRISLSVLL